MGCPLQCWEGAVRSTHLKSTVAILIWASDLLTLACFSWKNGALYGKNLDMTPRINAKTTEETFLENFEKDGKLLEGVAAIVGFAATAAGGDPLSAGLGLALILKTAGTVISAGSNILTRLMVDKSTTAPKLETYERFRLIFYVTCQRHFIEALNNRLSTNRPKLENLPNKADVKAKDVRELKEQLKGQIATVQEAEITYLFCIEPLAGDVPLYDAFEKWTSATLVYYGLLPEAAQLIAKESNKEARERFAVFLASKNETAEWMRNYLALVRGEQTSHLVSDLSAIRDTLFQWTDPAIVLRQNQQKAWENYRQSLAELPDLKETMFNEQFGVRQVFVQPRVVYQIAGTDVDPEPVPDLGRLLGALISSRVNGEDLVILCGGPGSGKSTLCRIMASELAKDSNVYPVFLRLRRVKEGAEIGQFIEESLQKQGLISRFADLRTIPNLVLILDGFDELVMASRARLRHFFNVLREDLGSGPLRNARAIVSGRDTLFPRGEGLPSGSHVLSLQPFDKFRVKAWGTKWRLLHKSGPGNTFHPEEFIVQEEKAEVKPPLHHLVSWPLTLHLVARVHTAGKLEVRAKASKKIEKAYLYRSILAETSDRQVEQTEGTGRFDAKKMRDFLRALAWEMHSVSVDSMDPADVMPILKRFYPDKNEQDLAELAEVAIVNSPELTKGEETGFEFVHKSFAEFLVAEKFADLIERVAFKAPDYASDEVTWRMSEQDAARELAPILGIRLIPEEVQEMFEPMLGCFGPFSKGERVDEVVTVPARRDGLTRVVERFEFILAEFLRGNSLEAIARVVNPSSRIRNPLEAHANYCAGIILVGAAAARQLRQFDGKGKPGYSFSAEPFKGAFWRCLCVLAAGGITLYTTFSTRLLDGVRARVGDEDKLNDVDSPIKLGLLGHVDGYDSALARFAYDASHYTVELEREVMMLQVLVQLLALPAISPDPEKRVPFAIRESRYFAETHRFGRVSEMSEDLVRGGLLPDDLRGRLQGLEYELRDVFEYTQHKLYASSSRDGAVDVRELLDHFMNSFRPSKRSFDRDFWYWLRHVVDRLPSRNLRRS
jgi:hypothetical protein